MGPELTKALQKGQVGLNDLMKFLISLGDEYGELAKKIAGSSENAGARLQVAFNKMRIEVGKALQPIGAEFQDIFKAFIEEITPTLVKVLPKIGEAFLAIAKKYRHCCSGDCRRDGRVCSWQDLGNYC